MSDNVKALRADYEKLAAAVHDTDPNTGDRNKAMAAKKEAFLKWKAADDARVELEEAQRRAPAVTQPAALNLKRGTTTPMAVTPPAPGSTVAERAAHGSQVVKP